MPQRLSVWSRSLCVAAGVLSMGACSRSNATPSPAPSATVSAAPSAVSSAPRPLPPVFTTPEQAAQHGLKLFRQLARVEPASVGLSSQAEIADASLVPIGYTIRWLDRTKLVTPSPFDTKKLLSSLDDKKQRLYAVSVKQQLRGCILVEERGGQWKSVTYGDPGLAKGLRDALTRASRLPGYDPRQPPSDLLFAPDLSMYFVVQGRLAPNEPLPQLVPTRRLGRIDQNGEVDGKSMLTAIRFELLRTPPQKPFPTPAKGL